MDIRLKTSNILRKSSGLLNRIAMWVHKPPQRKRVVPWFANNGDKTLRLDYDLNENAIVFDLGGYEGQWSSDIFNMYGCWIHVFEPVDEFAQNIARRFAQNRKLVVHPFGLAEENRMIKLGLDQNGSSIFKPGTRLVNARLVRAIDFMQAYNISMIDLMKINIEGGEYDLLEHLIESGYVLRIKNIQVQFHDFVNGAEDRMRRIQAALAQTHYLTYQFLFVWENWHIKDDLLENSVIIIHKVERFATPATEIIDADKYL